MRRKYTFYKTDEYQEWFDDETAKSQVQIVDRLSKIEMYDHWGDHKPLDEDKDVWELKWVNGRRLYYAYLEELDILLLLGGNKNGQSKDITKAKKILRKYTET